MMIYPYHGAKVLIRKRDLSGKESSATFSFSVRGKSHYNSENTNDFIDLGLINSKLNSCRMIFHLEYFPLEIVY